MESDCCQHMKRYLKCQIYANNIHVPSSALHNLTSPWPFSMLGLNMIGPTELKASNGHRFILMAINYFTKWVEAPSYTSITNHVVVKFIKRDIICRDGLPTHIITDNGTNLNNKAMIELCEQFKIKHHNSMPYHPKMNGAVEATNKNIKKIVQKMVVTCYPTPYTNIEHRCKLPQGQPLICWCMAQRRVIVKAELEDVEWVQSWRDQLNLIKEKRLMTLCHEQLYQKRIKRAFDKKVRPRSFKEGDLVLKKIPLNAKDSRGKWTPNYEGPYIVKRAFSRGALILADPEGHELIHSVNADIVKLFYP
ncbi:Pol polyprotein, partial [Mucuna pruriens]